MTADALRWAAAVHEAGHAIVGCEFGHKLVSLSIDAANDGTGGAEFDPDERIETNDELCIRAGGREATDILALTVHDTMDRHDLGSMALLLELAGHSPEESLRMRRAARACARSILEAHRDQLEDVARELNAAGYLDADHFELAMHLRELI